MSTPDDTHATISMPLVYWPPGMRERFDRFRRNHTQEKPMSREITSHKVNGLNEVLKITAVDEPGPGGANHVYDVEPTVGNAKGLRIEFHKGPLDGGAPKGLSNEALLAILKDRLTAFQAGEFACMENEHALDHIGQAMVWLHKRTQNRMARGVEGKLEK